MIKWACHVQSKMSKAKPIFEYHLNSKNEATAEYSAIVYVDSPYDVWFCDRRPVKLQVRVSLFLRGRGVGDMNLGLDKLSDVFNSFGQTMDLFLSHLQTTLAPQIPEEPQQQAVV